jgi:outer membrane protein
MRAEPVVLAAPPSVTAAVRWLRLTSFVPLVLLASCGTVALMTRPEGDGGWSSVHRVRELERLARAADVDLDPAAERSAQPTAQTATEAAATAGAAASAAAAAHDETRDALAPPLTLRTALERAARGNRRLAEARQQLAIARQSVWQARGRLFPATTGSGRYTWHSDAQTNSVTLPGPDGTVVTRTIEVRDQELGQLSGVVTIPLDLSGELWATLAAAQAGYRGEAARLWAVTLEQDLTVIAAYFTLLEAERLRDVTVQTITLNRQQLAYAQDRFDSGRLTKNEVLVVQVVLRDTEQRRLQRELAIDQARWALNQAIGARVDAPTEVADVRDRPRLPAAAEALTTAYRDNPLLLALLEDQQRLDATASALARSRLPRFAGGGSVDKSTADTIEPNLISAGFVGFELDLGTDTRREASIVAARLAAEQNRTRIERELRELEQAVRSTQRQAEERLAALDAAEIAVVQAEENLRIRQQQFDAGRATSEDVLDAVALLAVQRATLASALYQAHTRRAELQRLMGQSLEALVGDEEVTRQ